MKIIVYGLLCGLIINIKAWSDIYPDDFCYPSGLCQSRWGDSTSYAYACDNNEVYLIQYDDLNCTVEIDRNLASPNESKYVDCSQQCTNYVYYKLWRLELNDTQCTAATHPNEHVLVIIPIGCSALGGDSVVNSCTDTSVTNDWYNDRQCSETAGNVEHIINGCHFYRFADPGYNSTRDMTLYLKVLHCGMHDIEYNDTSTTLLTESTMTQSSYYTTEGVADEGYRHSPYPYYCMVFSIWMFVIFGQNGQQRQ
eukprot:17084_1